MKFFRLFSLCLLLIAVSMSVYSQKMSAEDILAKHLDSIAPTEKRSALKNMIAVGDVTVTYISQKNLPANGRIVIASSEGKMFYGMSLNAADYPLEKFIYDGDKTDVAFVRPGARTVFGNFVLSNSDVLKESLLGGTLSSNWALMNLATNKGKLSSGGTKKINGKEVYVLGYTPKGGGDVDINLYFDKETFRHVRTEYKRTASAVIGRTPDQSSRFNESRLKITEDFSDFKAETGMTLPHTYSLNYTVSGQNGTTEIQWNFNLSEFAFNQKLDASTFNIGTE